MTRRTRFIDPNIPPPGTAPLTYGTGLVLDGTTVRADIGTGAGQVAAGATARDALSLRGQPIGIEPPTTGQVLTWDGVAYNPANPTGGEGGGGPAPPASVLLDPATPNRLLILDGMGSGKALTTAEAVAFLRAMFRTADPMDGAGWTSMTESGGATAAWGGAALTFTIPPACVGFDVCGVERADAQVDGNAYDVILNIAASGPIGAAEEIAVYLGQSETWCTHVRINGDGYTSAVRRMGASEYYAFGGGDTSTVRTAILAGNFWLRIQRRPGHFVIAYAVTSTPPTGATKWTTYYVSPTDQYQVLYTSEGSWMRLAMTRGGTNVSTITYTVTAMRRIAQNPGAA